jgi:pSer/pThr/pTyr-binding forkhead associated (FHA) protein
MGCLENPENGGTIKSKLIIQDFKYAPNRGRKQNTLVIEQEDFDRREFRKRIICLGRSPENDLVFREMEVSRRHCVIINYPGDVYGRRFSRYVLLKLGYFYHDHAPTYAL